MSTGRVFDFHARLVPQRDPLSWLDTHGIARAVVCAGGVVDLDRLSAQLLDGGHVETSADNETVRAAAGASGGRLVPFYFANPYAGVAAYRGQAHRFRGLELSPAVYGLGFDDPRTVALVAVAAGAGHPVYTVCLGRPGTRARDLVALACRFPAVPFVFGHCGLIPLDTAGLATIAAQRNIVAETSGCYTAVARSAIDRLGPDRVLFGTEYPVQDPGVELAKLAALGLDADTWTKVAWRNAHRVLGEDCP